MAFKDGAAQIIKLTTAGLSLIALPMGWVRVKAALGNLRGGAGLFTASKRIGQLTKCPRWESNHIHLIRRQALKTPNARRTGRYSRAQE